MKQYKSHLNHGFSLMELVVTISIVSILGIVISKFQRDVFSFNRYFSNSLTAGDSAQKLLRPMTAEIRSASPSNSGSYPIESIGDNSFTFYSDIDNDGLKEWIRYSLTGTTLNKETIKPTGTPLIYNVSNKKTQVFMTGVRNIPDGIPIFTYYDSTYTGGSGGVVSSTNGLLADVRLIGVKIRIDPDVNQSPTTLEVSTQVAIRNLKIQQ
ncbi:MAG: prepilin-type N-terminal cleavage/methylation domain-containing protein [Candidatus Pacebacteria bacterium]|nr:prepilin-type N-terminal cleavage/methylation domain-containing protein [Candidatus Paceibacterota bacterium]